MTLVRKMGGKSVNLTEDEVEDLSLGVLGRTNAAATDGGERKQGRSNG